MTEMQKQIIEWLANGETGLSSKTMAFVIGFGVVPKKVNYPRDPSDLRRCMQLLSVAPKMRHCLDKIAEIHPVWAEIVKHWDELERLYNEETGKVKMPKTYELLKRLTENDPDWIQIGNGISIRFGS